MTDVKDLFRKAWLESDRQKQAEQKSSNEHVDRLRQCLPVLASAIEQMRALGATEQEIIRTLQIAVEELQKADKPP